MANNYLQFCDQLKFKYDSEKEWWRATLAVGSGYPEEDWHPEAKDLFEKLVDSGYDDYGFQYDLEDNSIIFYAEEFGEPYQVAALVHEFFKEMRPDGDDVFIITWAETCSKMRIDNFGGGTIIATKDGVGQCGVNSQIEWAKNHISKP